MRGALPASFKSESGVVKMGASEFLNVVKGKSVNDAFNAVVSNARHEYGHGGYTGTIAEKSEVVEIRRPKGVRSATVLKAIDAAFNYSVISDAVAWGDMNASKLVKLQANYPKFNLKAMAVFVDDKWGPAGGIDLGNGKVALWGMASS